MEIWKDIEGYEGLYQVSNLGNVKRNDSGKVLKFHIDTKGYAQHFLYKDGVRKCFLTHRLVAKAFLQNPNNLPEINHKDENRLNNIAENLEWCDRTYNVNYGKRTEKTRKKVCMFSLNEDLIYVWDSMSKAAQNMNIPVTNISACCLNKAKTAGGYVWKLAEEVIKNEI